jgi:hypothetical protein
VTTPRPSRAAQERTRHAEQAEQITAALDGDPVLDWHPVEWASHPVPWCGGACPGGESWPCPPAAAAYAAAQLAGAR